MLFGVNLVMNMVMLEMIMVSLLNLVVMSYDDCGDG